MQKKCGIILFNEATQMYFLVYGRQSKKWGFPKGHMEINETEQMTALREFYEETGYRFKDQENLSFQRRLQVKNNIYFQMVIKDIDELHKTRNMIPDQAEILKAEWKDMKSILSMDIEKCNFGLKHWIVKRKYESFKKEQIPEGISF